jgi:CheY-like chemotaxis protein
VGFVPVSFANPVTFTKRHILIVDDEPDMRDLAVDVLVDAGYSAVHGCDGAEALEALDSTPMYRGGDRRSLHGSGFYRQPPSVRGC